MADILGDRPAAVARELTKRFEEVRRGALPELAAAWETALKGEIVIVVGGRPDEAARDPEADPAFGEDLDAMILAGIEAGESVRSVAAAVAGQTGTPRRTVYQRALALSQRRDRPA